MQERFEVPAISTADKVKLEIAVEENSPRGWKGEVWLDGKSVLTVPRFGQNNGDDPRELAGALANFLDDDPEVAALEPHRERLGAFGAVTAFRE